MTQYRSQNQLSPQFIEGVINRFTGVYRDNCTSWWREQFIAYPIEFSGSSVVIIGSDCGTTTIYAYLRGADRFIEYEVNEVLIRAEEAILNALGLRINRQFMGAFRGELYIPGESDRVLIVDCEGCESMLREVDMDAFPRLCVAIHAWVSDEDRGRLLGYLRRRNAVLTHVTPDAREYVLCTTLPPGGHER